MHLSFISNWLSLCIKWVLRCRELSVCLSNSTLSDSPVDRLLWWATYKLSPVLRLYKEWTIERSLVAPVGSNITLCSSYLPAAADALTRVTKVPSPSFALHFAFGIQFAPAIVASKCSTLLLFLPLSNSPTHDGLLHRFCQVLYFLCQLRHLRK